MSPFHRSASMLAALVASVLLLTALPLAPRAAAAELLMFDSAGCSWCRRWDAEVGIGYPHSEEGRRAPLRRLDVSRTNATGVRLQSRVTATPTFVLVEDGVEVGRITGYPGADFFWGMLGQLLDRLTPEPPAPRRDPERSAALRSAGG